MEFMYKIAEMQWISPHALLLGVWINELASVQIESWHFWMKQCDLLAPRQYIVSNLFTSDKGVEEITGRMVKWEFCKSHLADDIHEG